MMMIKCLDLERRKRKIKKFKEKVYTIGELLSPKYLIQSALTVLPFGLRHAAETVDHLVAQR